MAPKTKQVIVYNGRFNPFHLGHAHVLSEALKAGNLVIVLIGSSGLSRSLKNPFSFAERREMIWAWYEETLSLDPSLDDTWGKLKIVASRDYPYNDTLWQRSVQRVIKDTVKAEGKAYENATISLIGSDRDDSTWYLHAFPQWAVKLVPPYSQGNGVLDVSATNVRGWLFSDTVIEPPKPSHTEVINGFTQALVAGKKLLVKFVENLLMTVLADDRVDYSHVPDMLPDTTLAFLERFKLTPDFQSLAATYQHVVNYKRRAKLYPYPPIYQTVDSVVIQSGHVLVVVRGHEPGKGLWALPGGFVNANERLLAAAIRETIEETLLKLIDSKNWKRATASMLRSAVRGQKVFDKPDRSDRGRTITNAFFFRLDDTNPLPVVKGMKQGNTDPECDVVECFWLPIDQALERMDMWFEDHHAIVEWAVGNTDHETLS